MNITIKKSSLYYFLLVLLSIILLLTHYPRIYGKDAFQVMWMANALRNGAFFSDNTWLIHLSSYFGYYPFSHWPIGVPLVLAFLITLLNFFSFGILGMIEAILAFNIILILIIYKSAKSLGKILFEEEWSRFIFVAATLFSMYVINDITMTISTRIIITIIMIVAMNLTLRVLYNSISTFKAMIYLFLLLIIGALTHRLWVIILIPILIMIFTAFIRRFRNLQKLAMFLILPLSIIAYFIGLEVIGTLNFDFLSRLDPNQTFTPFIDENSLFGRIILISWFYIWNLGVISVFFPIGVIIMLYKLAILLKNSKGRNSQLKNNPQFIQKYYLILFIIPFSFLLPATFYSIVLFFPLLIIFSIYGLIYIKRFLSNYSETLSWLLLPILLFISIVYSFLKVEVSVNINLWYVFVLSFISLILFLFIIIISHYKTLKFSKFSLNPLKMKKGIWILILTISMLIFTITTVETNRAGMRSSLYPWENPYLTNEEIEIIEYFQDEDIDGLIFTTNDIIANKISGAGFLPAFHGRSYIGNDLWYGLISPNEVHENTDFSFSLSNLFEQIFFRFWPKNATYYYETSPLEVLMRNIIILNMTYQEDQAILRFSYNVQYVVSIKDSFLEGGYNWTLIKSLQQSELEPVFSTQNLLVWKIEV